MKKNVSCVLITNKNSWISEPIIDALIQSNNVELLSVIFYNGSKNKAKIKKRILQYDFKKIGLKILDVITNKLNSVVPFSFPFSRKTSFSTVKKHKLDHFITYDLNSTETIEHINRYSPKIVLLCSCSQIIKTHFIQQVKSRILNVHDSLLPAHKGPSPSFWVLYNKEKVSGFTIHEVQEEIDSGRIVYQEKMLIESKIQEEELIKQIYSLCATKIDSILMNVSDGFEEFNSSNLDLSKESYEGLPTLKQRKELKAIQKL